MFECRVCSEKDKRLADKDVEIRRLSDQVDFFKQLSFPKATRADVTPEYLEMDRILSGSDEPIEYRESELEREASSLLMGSYDHSQVEVD